MKTQKVVCVYAIIAEVSLDTSKANTRLDEITNGVHQALDNEFGFDDRLSLPPTCAFAWVEDKDVFPNIHSCNNCGRLGSASNMANEIFGMLSGKIDGKSFYCDECLAVRIHDLSNNNQ